MLTVTATELPRLMQCIGSLQMPPVPTLEEINTVARDEGNAAHWLAEQGLRFGRDISTFDGHKAPNGIFITHDMINHVGEYVDGVNRGGKFDETEVETSIVGQNFQINSRADHINFSDILYIDDFKYGHKIVEVANNWTLIAHAIGFCLKYNVTPEIIVFTIYQPRARHHDGTRREWSIPYETLANFYYPHIFDVLENPADNLTTGPNCRKCPALAHCPAASAAGFSAVEESARAFTDTITNEQLAIELNILKTAEQRLSDRKQSLEELAKYRLKQGEVVKGYCVENGKGNTTWKKHITPEMLKAITGLDLTTSKLVTPAAMKRALKNDQVADMLIKALTERPNTGVKLKRVDADKQASAILNQQ